MSSFKLSLILLTLVVQNFLTPTACATDILDFTSAEEKCYRAKPNYYTEFEFKIADKEFSWAPDKRPPDMHKSLNSFKFTDTDSLSRRSFAKKEKIRVIPRDYISTTIKVSGQSVHRSATRQPAWPCELFAGISAEGKFSKILIFELTYWEDTDFNYQSCHTVKEEHKLFFSQVDCEW